MSETGDIKARLRAKAQFYGPLRLEAADRIEALEAKVAEIETRLVGAFQDKHAERTARTTAEARLSEALATLRKLTDAKALKGIRALVAGWNGENLPEPHTERHPPRLGATIATNCGAIYELDEALQGARTVLSEQTKRHP